jgi:hypothetical protein
MRPRGRDLSSRRSGAARLRAHIAEAVEQLGQALAHDVAIKDRDVRARTVRVDRAAVCSQSRPARRAADVEA